MTAEANETLRRLKVLQAPLKKERPSLSKWNLTASYHLQHGAYNLGWSRRLVHLPGLVCHLLRHIQLLGRDIEQLDGSRTGFARLVERRARVQESSV